MAHTFNLFIKILYFVIKILKLDVRSYVDRSKGIIQIRSAARLGQSDLGVNLRRVEYLFNQLEKF